MGVLLKQRSDPLRRYLKNPEEFSFEPAQITEARSVIPVRVGSNGRNFTPYIDLTIKLVSPNLKLSENDTWHEYFDIYAWWARDPKLLIPMNDTPFSLASQILHLPIPVWVILKKSAHPTGALVGIESALLETLERMRAI